MSASALSERSQSGSACHRAGRSLNDIREPRPLSFQAQQIVDRYEAVRRLRYSRFLGIRG